MGCGALGCEYVKNFALNGVCCGPEGLLEITDNDRIEVSNLNRQFLFQGENVGQAKSTAATQRATSMNAAIRINARTDLVAPHTEHIFDDKFWYGLDLVCNALDNMAARFYVDEKCVFFEKPLLESGTMGTGANVDVVVPHMTQSYADGGQADEGGGVPMCTLRNFPHLIDHCIEWARAQFEDLFVSPAEAAGKFLSDPGAFIKKTRRETLELADKGPRSSAISKAIDSLPLLIATLELAAGATIEGCVSMAWKAFHLLFRDKIVDLITAYPVDAKTESGDPFWTGHKKFPAVAAYDAANENHVGFIISATNLFAHMLKVHPVKYGSEKNDEKSRWMAQYRDEAWLASVLAKLPVPEYVQGKVSMEGATDKSTGADEAAEEAAAQARLEALLEQFAGE